jgi:hypothetical protein
MTTETCYGTARLVNESELELERYVDCSDTIVPFFRVPLTGEHLAAWAVRGLRESGCRCRRLVKGGSTLGAKRVTRSDQGMVYYSTDGLSATLIRGGKERALSFAFDSKDSEAEFIHFIAELMREGAGV